MHNFIHVYVCTVFYTIGTSAVLLSIDIRTATAAHLFEAV